MVELLPLDQPEDIEYVKNLLIEFNEKTGSVIAADLLSTWPEPTTRFIKVCIHSFYYFTFFILLRILVLLNKFY